MKERLKQTDGIEQILVKFPCRENLLGAYGKGVSTASPERVFFRNLGALNFHYLPLGGHRKMEWERGGMFLGKQRAVFSKFHITVSEITFISFYSQVLDFGFLRAVYI